MSNFDKREVIDLGKYYIKSNTVPGSFSTGPVVSMPSNGATPICHGPATKISADIYQCSQCNTYYSGPLLTP